MSILFLLMFVRIPVCIPPIERQLHAMYSPLERFASSCSVCVQLAMTWTSNLHIILSELPE